MSSDTPTQGGLRTTLAGVLVLVVLSFGITAAIVGLPAPLTPDDGVCRDEVYALTGSSRGSFQCSHPDHTGTLETRAIRSGCQTNDMQNLVCVCPAAE